MCLMTSEMAEEMPEDETSLEDTSGRQNLDICLLMNHVERLEALLAPVLYLGAVLGEITRWEWGNFNMALLLAANNSMFFLPTSVIFLLWTCSLVLCATAGYAHSKTNILVKVLPSTKVEFDPSDEIDHRVLIQKYRNLLFAIDEQVTRTNGKLTRFYQLLKWEDTHLSFRFYSCLMLVVTILHVIPAKWVLILLLNILLLQHRFVQKLQGHHKPNTGIMSHLEESNVELAHDEDLSEDDKTLDMQFDPELGSASDLEHFSDDEAEAEEMDLGADIAALDKDEILKLGEDFEKEIKKLNVSGSCVKCGVAFTSLLKRRRLCNHCGNHFCSKCCSNKVPKFLFGATAPSAQTETVMVCEYCYLFLTGEKDK